MKRLLAFALFALAGWGAAVGGFRLLKKFPVPGNGGWDYLTVDSGARRLYVSHGNRVEVLDADSGAVVGRIANTRGVHGIALAPEFGRGFTSNGATASVTVFDLKTLAPVAEVKTGKNPDAIFYDPATRRVFANNGDSNSSTAIDAATAKAVGTIELGGAPEFAAADGLGHLFINLEDTNETVKVDSRNLKVLARWPLAPCRQPTSMAMDTGNQRLFIGCRNGLMAVVDAGSGKVAATAPIGKGVDTTIFDASTRQVLFSNGDGTLNVFHQDSPDRYSAVETVKTQRGAKTMALDPKTRRLFLSVAEYQPTPEKKNAVKPDSFTVLVFGRE